MFNATDIVNKGSWRVVVKTKPRVIYKIPREKDSESQSTETLGHVEDAYQEHEPFDLHTVASTYMHNEMNNEERIVVRRYGDH